MYLDHIFIITTPGAPEASRLTALGLREGKPNTHPGQGTSNRRFFLDNFTIELVFVSDAAEAASGAGSRLGILNRSEDATASPFGIVVRSDNSETAPNFPSWQYFPDYFPDDWCFYVGENSDQLEEPLCICMPLQLPKSKVAPDQIINPDWQLTALTIHSPRAELSASLKQFASIEKVSIEPGHAHLMTMKFNNGVAGRLENLGPELPLVIQW